MEKLFHWETEITLAGLFVLLLVLLITFTCLVMISSFCKGETQEKQRRLFIIAHPDDEVMFFAPSITSSCTSSAALHSTYVLCMTNGNFYGLGRVREKELMKSCKILGIPKENVVVLNNSSYLDGSDSAWDMESVANTILDHCLKWGIHNIVTFDSYGVSGHPNHITIYESLKARSKSNKESPELVIDVYTLESVNIIRKYSSVIDIVISAIDCTLRRKTIVVSSPINVFKAWASVSFPAMAGLKQNDLLLNLTPDAGYSILE